MLVRAAGADRAGGGRVGSRRPVHPRSGDCPWPWGGIGDAGQGNAGPVGQERDPRPFRSGSGGRCTRHAGGAQRSEEHTSELQSLMRISYAAFCLKNTYTVTSTSTTKISIKNV